MANPGERVGRNKAEKNQPPGLVGGYDVDQTDDAERGSDVMEDTAGAILMLRQVKWPEFFESLIAHASIL